MFKARFIAATLVLEAAAQIGYYYLCRKIKITMQ
jgi:hypothetical protein